MHSQLCLMVVRSFLCVCVCVCLWFVYIIQSYRCIGSRLNLYGVTSQKTTVRPNLFTLPYLALPWSHWSAWFQWFRMGLMVLVCFIGFISPSIFLYPTISLRCEGHSRYLACSDTNSFLPFRGFQCLDIFWVYLVVELRLCVDA